MPIVKTHIHDSELFHDLKAMGRDNFSYDGARALMSYLDELSEDMGENIEYDPIAFCCDYAEYPHAEFEGLSSEYNEAPERIDYDNADEHGDALIDWLRNQTTVIELNGGIIIQSF